MTTKMQTTSPVKERNVSSRMILENLATRPAQTQRLYLNLFSRETRFGDICKQCRPGTDDADHSISVIIVNTVSKQNTIK